MSASEDLLFIAQRLEGVLSLIPTLQKIESLSNYQKELEAVVKQLTVTVDEHKADVVAKQGIAKDLEDKAKAFLADIKSHESKLEALKKHISDLKSKF